MRPPSALPALPALLAAALLASAPASADVPNGASFLQALGPRAAAVLAPKSGRIAALVPLSSAQDPVALGLEPFLPGFARLHGSSADLLAFAAAHPDVPFEVAPPLHTLLNYVGISTQAGLARSMKGLEGTGVLVGVADTGLDVTHPDMRDPTTGHSRVAWILDLSLPPKGLYPALESQFGVKDGTGKVVLGAVLQGSDIDAMIAAHEAPLPQDEVGHGTHVTSIAVGNGGGGKKYVGIAPEAQIVFARIARDSSGSFETDDMVSGVSFLFNRADAMKRPIAVNLSLGTDFGPHDGTMSWEQVLASFVGPASPGHVLTVAAGNSGSVVFQEGQPLVHQNVFVTPGTTTRVPVSTQGATTGSLEVWVTTHAGASLSVGLDGPDGQIIAPVASGKSVGKSKNGYSAGVTNGSSVSGSQVPAGSYGAIVVWSGQLPSGEYDITLEGQGTADLYIEADGDAQGDGTTNVGFTYGVREGTINLPATSPSLLAVGCTVNRADWTSIDGVTVGIGFPLLDTAGGLPDPSMGSRDLIPGEICYFSSAGPTVTGVPKPEISAPGGIVIAAMSQQALPGVPTSAFTNPGCPPPKGSYVPDYRCLEIDPTHGVLAGTSMSAPQVAGAAALLLQRDPTLTQAQVTALVQSGAHSFRIQPQFEDQGGVGELDVLGAVDALEQLNDPNEYLPGACAAGGQCPSWLTLSADHAPADGSTSIVAIVELRTADGSRQANLFEPSRLAPIAIVGGAALSPPPTLVRKAPGLWFFNVQLPPGLGGQSLTVGATFDGVDIVPRKTVPIATDTWTASYTSSGGGSSCGVARGARGCEGRGAVVVGLALALAGFRRRRRRGE